MTVDLRDLTEEEILLLVRLLLKGDRRRKTDLPEADWRRERKFTAKARVFNGADVQ